jgi:hypothetical protein
MYLYERKEYDPGEGIWRTLAPAIQAVRTANLWPLPPSSPALARAFPPANKGIRPVWAKMCSGFPGPGLWDLRVPIIRQR